MAVKYAKIEVNKFKKNFWGDCKAWKPEQIESVVENIVEGIGSYKDPSKLKTEYLIGRGGRIDKAKIESKDGLIICLVTYDADYPSLDIEIDFKAEGEEHKEDYVALEDIAKKA